MWKASVFAGLYALAHATSASSHDAYLYTIDQNTSPYPSSQVSTASSETANAILARRRGQADSNYLYTADDGILADINQLGGYQQPLFGAGTGQVSPKIFVRIDGFDGTVSQFDTLPDLWIEHPTTALLKHFEARPHSDQVCEYELKVKTKKSVSVVYQYTPGNNEACLLHSEIEYLPRMLAIYSSVPTSNNVAGKGMHTFLRTLKHLQATENIESTVLILPTLSKLAKAKSAKRDATSEEDPLDLPNIKNPLSSISQLDSTNKTSNTTHPLPSVIPQCFKSSGACENTTNSCSGHGSCYQAYTDCFKCRCGTTVVRINDDGTRKTVQWGGNACQKKDISTQFVLFASIGVLLTTIVAGALGMLYSMGSQELPSVIGAGVVGPRAQK